MCRGKKDHCKVCQARLVQIKTSVSIIQQIAPINQIVLTSNESNLILIKSPISRIGCVIRKPEGWQNRKEV